MMISQTAKTYAKGLVQTIQNGSFDYDIALNDLQTVLNILNSSAELQTVLCSPTVTVEQKNLIIQDIFEQKISSVILNLLKLLIEKDRFVEFEQIFEAFKIELDEINNIKQIRVISAIELNEDYKNRIIAKLSEKLQKKVITKWEIDSDIIAGLVIHIDDNVIDTSIKNKLENLSKIKGNI